MLQKYLLSLLLILAISACSTTNMAFLNKTEHLKSAELFNDQLFPDYQQQHIESEHEIFYLSDAVKKYMDDNIFPVHGSAKRIELLADILFDQASLNLIYANDANTTASQTFVNQQANCLSMTILAYSMAKYAGLDVVFQEVKIPEYWVRRDGHSLLNGHINLKIKPEKDPTHRVALQFGSEAVEVDFNRNVPMQHFIKKPSSKARVMAMFYNNKGADALLAGDFSRAYAYFKQALVVDPEFIPAWGNLGILYRYINQFDLAESAYLQALNLDNNNLNNLENLAILKEFEGQSQQASELYRMLDNKRQSNPYYHFIQGEEQYDHGNWEQAIVYYNRALRLDNKVHEFYFGLAKAYYQLGDTDHSKRYLKMAKRNSINEAMENRYQGKLDLLSRN
ncbi:tetratricopeptide repeat protein [Neptunicella sp. SCSIO 80796]|uniref:tetratricopeptide repeat protein n=1 Tax=Neptunicella plasticusilytica TaxID=3117012 RepID=UPI003A4E2419